jgi:hypothetical protein
VNLPIMHKVVLIVDASEISTSSVYIVTDSQYRQDKDMRKAVAVFYVPTAFI